MSENYMDRYETAEQFIRAEILANRGTDSVVTKQELARIAGWKAPEGARLDKLSKAQLLDLLIEQYGEQAYCMFPVGVNPICFYMKFGISHVDLVKLAKAGFITVTGEKRFRKWGRNCYAKLYSAYDYFQLTKEDIGLALAEINQTRQGSKV